MSAKINRNLTNAHNTAGYFYIIQEREFVKTKEPIYKVGKTKQNPQKRLGQYPNNSIVYLVLNVSNHDDFEKKVLKLLREKFIRRMDIGYEYFFGDVNLIIKTVYEFYTKSIKKYGSNIYKIMKYCIECKKKKPTYEFSQNDRGIACNSCENDRVERYQLERKIIEAHNPECLVLYDLATEFLNSFLTDNSWRDCDNVTQFTKRTRNALTRLDPGHQNEQNTF